VVEQPWFLNQVAEIKTDETPFGLLKWCLDLEHRQGRVRLVDKGPRTLDVDVLLFGGLTVQTDSLTVPHPRLLERRFVLLPLSDLAPEILIPGVGQTVDEALKKVLNTAQVRPFEGRSMTC
jgi:2-amino-4-hydroxy-6-hydroxymethyldihydropteridine diphosphokinase